MIRSRFSARIYPEGETVHLIEILTSCPNVKRYDCGEARQQQESRPK